MSRIIANNIRHNDATADSITLDSAGNVSAPGNLSVTGTSTLTGNTTVTGSLTANGIAYPSAGPLSNRNLIINGAMQVAQRGTTKTGVSDGATEGYATADRFAARFSSGHTGVVTNNQSTEVPTGQGFSTSYHVDVTTAVATPTGSMRASVRYKTEAQDLANSGWNYTSTSSYVTLSFWARSSKTGAHCIHIVASDTTTDRYYLAEYSLTADTWERISIPIPGHANAVINNDNGIGFEIDWILSVGPDVDGGTSGAWHSTTQRATSNQVNVFDSTDGEFYLTGVQLEVGSVATPFEHRSYGDELARCQRYYQKMIVEDTWLMCSRWRQDSGVARCNVFLRETMRAAPTFSFTGTWETGSGWGGDPVLSISRPDVFSLQTTLNSVAANNVVILRSQTTDASLDFSAEL